MILYFISSVSLVPCLSAGAALSFMAAGVIGVPQSGATTSSLHMVMMKGRSGAAVVAALLSLASPAMVVVAQQQQGGGGAAVVTEWNKVVADAIVQNKKDSNVGTRILAITHVAQWRAVQDVIKARGLTVEAASGDASVQPALAAAVASAGKAALLGVFPEANVSVNALYDKQTANSGALKDALDAGARSGAAVVEERKTDGSTPAPANFTGSNDTGKWRPTPPAFMPGLTPQWATLKTWALDSPKDFRLPAPPALDSDTYKTSYLEVLSVGNKTSSKRTNEQTDVAVFWSGNVEVLLADLTRQVASNLSLVDATRVLAVASVAAADAREAAWDSKFFYNAWRPVTAIPLGNSGVGGLPKDTTFTPVFKTPNHPEYPMGHVTTGEAVVTVLRGLTGSDVINATITSYTLPNKTRAFTSLNALNQENLNSRVWGGVHYRFSGDASLTLGKAVGKKVLDTYGGGKDADSKARKAAVLRLLRANDHDKW